MQAGGVTVSCESLHEPLEKPKEDRYSGLPLAEEGHSSLMQPLSGPCLHGRGRGQCGQATKGMWGMSGRQEAMKGVEDCDKPGEMVKRVLIPGSLN